MATLRCTKKLLDKLGVSVKDLAPASAPTNTLGDWYATYVPTRPKHLILAVNEKSRLAVLFPSAPLKTLAPRFLEAVRARLVALALAPEVIEAELAAMNPLTFGPTQSRSVLATMNQFVEYLNYYAEENTLEGIAVRLGEDRLGPLEGKPPRAVARLLLDPAMVTQESQVVYQLKVTLTEVEPAIWRRILLPSGYTLRQLHKAIQVAMGWKDYHLHSFEIQGKEYGLPYDGSVTLLGALPPVGERFEYIYDFGDDWVHEIVVEARLAASDVGFAPACLEGARACPPEDCGGRGSYQEILAALADPTQRDEEWAGEGFDPTAFDQELANRRLRYLR